MEQVGSDLGCVGRDGLDWSDPGWVGSGVGWIQDGLQDWDGLDLGGVGSGRGWISKGSHEVIKVRILEVRR